MLRIPSAELLNFLFFITLYAAWCACSCAETMARTTPIAWTLAPATRVKSTRTTFCTDTTL